MFLSARTVVALDHYLKNHAVELNHQIIDTY